MSAKSIINIVILSTLIASCSGRGKVDLSKATPLTAEPVSTPPTGSTSGSPPSVAAVSLFSQKPGNAVSFQSLATIDPVGTALIDDFDGDGIKNGDEKTTNIWIADYPQIETNIAAPVTMQIDVQLTTTGQTTEITSEITSSDFEDTRNQGTDVMHRNEIDNRTVQIQDEFSRFDASSGSQSSSESWNAKASVGVFGVGAGGGGGESSDTSNSWSRESGRSGTETKWPTIPFRNNVDRDAWAVKADSAERNARKYRSERRGFNSSTSLIGPNAGRVRAALYIKNLTNNMPVKVSNILASLVLETSTGEKVPLQSFRLRNDDFSLFTVNIYGGTEFGPYVINLPNLNTAEIEKAIMQGYSPKIYIVDYELGHVPDSNYRSLLLNFTGNNLKIVEENAKGRTAQIKILSPGARSMYRVAAFSASNQIANSCAVNLPQSSDTAVPGIALSQAMNRIACSGVNYQEENYLIDFSEIAPNIKPAKVVVQGIKSIGGVSSRIPCTAETHPVTGIKICRMKPISQWTDLEKSGFALWGVFGQGKFFAYSEYVTNSNGSIATYEGIPYAIDGTGGTPITKGIKSTIWAGDYYEIVYASMADMIKGDNRFGSNPLESGNSFNATTLWNFTSVTPENRYYPEAKSYFVGRAGFGDQVELTFALIKTRTLNPNFGTVTQAGNYGEYGSFSYTPKIESKKFTFDEAVQYEINLGYAGQAANWLTVPTPNNAGVSNRMAPCSESPYSVDYLNQTFTVCVVMPASNAGLPLFSDDFLSLYVRPKQKNEYRNIVWPQQLSKIRKFHGYVAGDAKAGVTHLVVSTGTGSVLPGSIITIAGATQEYTVLAVNNVNSLVDLNIEQVGVPGSGLLYDHLAGDEIISKDVAPSAPQVKLQIHQNFYTSWNAAFPSANLLTNLTGNSVLTDNLTVNNLGYDWSGATSAIYNFSDGSAFLDMENLANPIVATVPNMPTTDIRYDITSVNAPQIKQTFPGSGNDLGTFHQQRAGFSYLYGDRSITIWSYRRNQSDGVGGYSAVVDRTEIKAEVRDVVTGQSSGPLTVAFVDNTGDLEEIFPDFGAAASKDTIVISWYETSQTQILQVKSIVVKLPAAGSINPLIGSALTLGTVDAFAYSLFPPLKRNDSYDRNDFAPQVTWSSDGQYAFVAHDFGEAAAKVQMLGVYGTTQVVSSQADLSHKAQHARITTDKSNLYVTYEGNYQDNFSVTVFGLYVQKYQLIAGLMVPIYEFAVITDSTSEKIRMPRMVVKNDKGLIVWEDTLPATHDCFAKLLDFGQSGASALGVTFQFDTTTQCRYPRLAAMADTGKVLVGWYAKHAGQGALSESAEVGVLDLNQPLGPGIMARYAVDTNLYMGFPNDNVTDMRLSCGVRECWMLWPGVAAASGGTYLATLPYNSMKISSKIALPATAVSAPIFGSVAAQALATGTASGFAGFMDVPFTAFGSSAFGGFAVKNTGISLEGTGLLQYGINNFFTAALVKRDFVIRAKYRLGG